MNKQALPKVLIANRGEIAVRVLRSCKKLGIPTVAVYSEADKETLPVYMADEAVCIGPPPTPQSYLNMDAIISACRSTGAHAVHPGFGFLSENATFAERCKKEGLIFIGPSPESISVMGDKISARRQMIKAGVPVVPGVVDALKDVAEAKKVAAQVGYPVMIKATAGGGGKGMRKVENESQMESLFQAATSEAQKFFSNGALYLEKFIVNPHHIEVQLFGYGKDGAVHFFERECSLQRRNQKVVEEAPSPLITPDIRKKLTQVAVDGAKAINYLGAGTMEFVADDDGNFYFMEMNTRLQVEHTVTEWICGVDLVEEQLRLALGLPVLYKDQNAITIDGHAVQCRIYAEDPERFFPSPGRITRVRWPMGPYVRVDTHIEEGSEISMFYDPMIAKMTTWGRTRDEAIARMRVALQETVLLGIEHNVSFHEAVMNEERFISGRTTTGYIDDVFPQKTRLQKISDLIQSKNVSHDRELAAQLAVNFAAQEQGANQPSTTQDTSSAWIHTSRRSSMRGSL